MTKIKIKCPKCKTEVIEYDGRGTLALTKKCEECRHLVVYNPTDNTIKTTHIPYRATSSGTRYY